MKTATFLMDSIPQTGDPKALGAKLYRLSEPIEFNKYSFTTKSKTKAVTSYVSVSCAIGDDGRYQTYIFPANEHGDVLDWMHLAGSYKGGLDREKALQQAGYTVE